MLIKGLNVVQNRFKHYKNNQEIFTDAMEELYTSRMPKVLFLSKNIKEVGYYVNLYLVLFDFMHLNSSNAIPVINVKTRYELTLERLRDRGIYNSRELYPRINRELKRIFVNYSMSSSPLIYIDEKQRNMIEFYVDFIIYDKLETTNPGFVLEYHASKINMYDLMDKIQLNINLDLLELNFFKSNYFLTKSAWFMDKIVELYPHVVNNAVYDNVVNMLNEKITIEIEEGWEVLL